ncbi:MAG: hypothetical protein WCG34_05195 [Leptolinea sp.]
MDAPANTWSYFYAGYTVIFFVMGVYVASLAIRWRNLKLEIEALQEIKSG